MRAHTNARNNVYKMFVGKMLLVVGINGVRSNNSNPKVSVVYSGPHVRPLLLMMLMMMMTRTRTDWRQPTNERQR